MCPSPWAWLNAGGRDRSATDAEAAASPAVRSWLRELTAPAAEPRLPDVVRRLAEVTVEAVDGADTAGVTLVREGEIVVTAASSEFGAEVDAVQYALEQGPCVHAMTHQSSVVVASAGPDPRWPRFCTEMARLGVGSVLSLPLVRDETLIGCLNVYARDEDVFSETTRHAGEALARVATVAVGNLLVLQTGRDAATTLQETLADRAAVDMAVGVLMVDSRGDRATALGLLDQLAHRRGDSLAQAARSVLHAAEGKKPAAGDDGA